MVWLERYGVWAMARHEQVHAVLGDWETFCSSAGVGLSDFRKEKAVASAQHSAGGRSAAAYAHPRGGHARRVAPGHRCIACIVRARSRDSAGPAGYARQLRRGQANGGGVSRSKCSRTRSGSPRTVARICCPTAAWCSTRSVRGTSCSKTRWPTPIPFGIGSCRGAAGSAFAPGGFGAQIYAAVDAGKITEDEAALMVRSFLSAGLDTTVHALGNVIHCFARNPDQWRLLREDPRWRACDSKRSSAMRDRCRHSSGPPRRRST